MVNLFNKINNDELVRSSTILFIMIGLYSFFNYLFQMSMAKLLGPADYGILAVLMSIVYIFTIPSEAIQTVISKYVAILNVKNESGKIKDLFIRSLKKGFFISSILFGIFVIISFIISKFLNISNYLLILTGLLIFLVFLIPVIRGLFQGVKRFLSLGENLLIETISKLIISITLVYFGWRVYGAMIAVIVGILISLIAGLISLKKIIKAKREKFYSKNIYNSSLPILIATLSIVLMYSVDIILARRFFSPELAGQYAFVSLIGKVIIFVSSAIGKAMFPISTGNFEKGINDKIILKKSLIIVLMMSLISLIFYISIPELIIKIISLGSNEYFGVAHILFYLGLAYSLISLSYIIILFKLSKNKINKSVWLLPLVLIIQIILLSSFNNNLLVYSLATLFSSLLMFLYSIFLVIKR